MDSLPNFNVTIRTRDPNRQRGARPRLPHLSVRNLFEGKHVSVEINRAIHVFNRYGDGFQWREYESSRPAAETGGSALVCGRAAAAQ